MGEDGDGLSHKSTGYELKSLGDLSDRFEVLYDSDKHQWVVSGDCPECCAEVQRMYKITSVTAAAEGGIAVDDEVLDADLLRTMSCDCRSAHAERDKDVKGCGAYWKIKLT